MGALAKFTSINMGVCKMLRKNGIRVKYMSLLTFLLAVPLVLAMEELSTADTWDDTLAAAKKEGKLVVVLGGAASRNYRPVFKHFEKRFGIRTVVSTGGGGKQVDRILAERGARRFKVDIVMVGGTLGGGRLLPTGAVDPITPLRFAYTTADGK